ncbi:MAG: hypothetical protein RLY47_323 [Candidatus Parcubacteria bacterium]|jgi:hypothetical protein
MKKLFFLIALLFVFTSVPSFVHAAPALDSIPDAVKSRYEFDGSIAAVVSDGTTLYVGGNFTQITPTVGEPLSTARNYLAAFDVSDGSLIGGFDPNLNGGVTSLALSSDGSTLYMGGSFWCIGGEFEAACLESERFNLAAIDTTTGNATAFNPNPNGEVNTIALSSDDATLFAGGSFTDVNSGTARNYIAGFTTVDGVATDFNPDVDSTVWSIKLSVDESTVYAAGDFLTVNGLLPQEYIAEFDSDTGDITNFNAALDAAGQVLARSSDGTTLYVGGNFLEFRTLAGEGVPFDEVTQASVAYPKVSTLGGPGATIYASVPDGEGGWYIGGSFTNVGTTTQPRLAHITSSGVLDSAFDPDIDNATVFALALSPDGSTLYAGGQFNSVENGTVRDYVAAFDTTDGSVTAFDPSAGATVFALALSSDGGTLYMGGDFGTFDGGATFRNYVGAFTTVGAGTVTAFDPDADSTVRALALSDDDGTLYMGGDFTSFDATATARNNAGAFTTVGAGTVTAFDPNADGTIRTFVLSPDETSIYAGGSFTTIGGGSRTALAKLDTSDGSLVSAFDATVTGNGQHVHSTALSTDETTLYVVGDFTDIGSEARGYFGELNVTTGLATSFNPNFDGISYTVAVSTSTGDVYVGGEFSSYGAISAPYLLGIDLSDNSLITAFIPVPDALVFKLELSSDDALLYAGGDFADVNSGTSRDYLAAFDTTDGTATAFDPVGTANVYGLGLAADDTELYVGNYDINSGTSTLFFFNTGVGGTETLTVSKDGTGSGTVTSAPSGINCGVDCTEDYAADTEVTLTAVAADGSDFIGWSGGGCSGTGTCVVTMSAAQSVTATFDLEVGEEVEEEEEGEDDDNGGSGSGSHRKPISNPPSFHGDTNVLIQLQLKLIDLLKQLLQELMTQR